MGFHVAFLPSRAIVMLHFLRNVVEVKASRPPHVFKPWLVVGKGMLPVKYFRSNKSSFCVN